MSLIKLNTLVYYKLKLPFPYLKLKNFIRQIHKRYTTVFPHTGGPRLVRFLEFGKQPYYAKFVLVGTT